ncbi:MAG: DMT family transporter [Chloroflexi bacterium]|nr:DMT family transporter [Chloroflexota bacterium]
MNPSFLAAGFALSAALSWGSGDFSSGLSARRMGSFNTVFVTYSVGLVILVVVALARFEPLPPAVDLIWGGVAGLFGMVGIGFLLRGYAEGRMGIVAPVSAVLATALPVVFAALTEGLPRELQLIGFALALVSVWLLSRPDLAGVRPAGIELALLAGLGFAGFFISLDQVGRSAVFWPLVAARVSACAVMAGYALVTRRTVIPAGSPLRLVILAGLLDVSGNFFFLLAVRGGRLDVAAVLGSLYPAVTAIMAWLIIREHVGRLQLIGVAGAVLAIVLITV